MSDSQLEQYVAGERARGVPVEAIKAALRQSGWNEVLIGSAFGENPPPAGGTPQRERRVWPWVLGIALAIIIIPIILIFMTVDESLDSARQKARDARRASDIGMIRTAAALYYDTNGLFPASLEEMVFAGFLPSAPVDPTTNIPYGYESIDGQDYLFCVEYETRPGTCTTREGTQEE